MTDLSLGGLYQACLSTAVRFKLEETMADNHMYTLQAFIMLATSTLSSQLAIFNFTEELSKTIRLVKRGSRLTDWGAGGRGNCHGRNMANHAHSGGGSCSKKHLLKREQAFKLVFLS